LTERGANQEVVEEMIADVQRLADEELQANLLSMGLAFASLAFGKQQANQDWLIRRFQMLEDILQDTELYKYIKREVQEESLQEMREALQEIVQARFPKLLRLTKKQIAVVDDPAILHGMIVKMSLVQNAVQAREYLLEADTEED